MAICKYIDEFGNFNRLKVCVKLPDERNRRVILLSILAFRKCFRNFHELHEMLLFRSPGEWFILALYFCKQWRETCPCASVMFYVSSDAPNNFFSILYMIFEQRRKYKKQKTAVAPCQSKAWEKFISIIWFTQCDKSTCHFIGEFVKKKYFKAHENRLNNFLILV